jgi:hypothetical protein
MVGACRFTFTQFWGAGIMLQPKLLNRASGQLAAGLGALLMAFGGAVFAPYCPDQLLFSFGGYYYYSSKDCATGAAGNVLVYSQLVTTGCSESGGCSAEVLPHSELKPKGLVGDPPGGETEIPESAPYQLVPPTVELMTSFGRSTVSLAGGASDYPKIVATDVEGVTRYFKIYRLYLQGGSESFGVGTEVSAPPEGTTPAPATASFDSYGTGTMWVNYNDPYVGNFGFQCLYVAPATPEPGPDEGSGG